MPQVQEIQVINIDNVPYAVDAMSETSQRLVTVFNEWNQKEADARDGFMMVQAAKETLSRQIIEQVRKEKAEAEEANDNEEATTEEVATEEATTEEVATEEALVPPSE